MKIYWCIPESIFNTKDAEKHKSDGRVLENNIRKYYSQVEVEIILDQVQVQLIKMDGDLHS